MAFWKSVGAGLLGGLAGAYAMNQYQGVSEGGVESRGPQQQGQWGRCNGEDRRSYLNTIVPTSA